MMPALTISVYKNTIDSNGTNKCLQVLDICSATAKQEIRLMQILCFIQDIKNWTFVEYIEPFPASIVSSHLTIVVKRYTASN